MKNFRKLLTVFLIYCFLAVGTAYLSYYVTVKNLEENAEAVTVSSFTPDGYSEKGEKQFFVCLDGNKLSIYECENGNKRYIYSERISTSALPKNDIELLETGVVLKSKAELTEFIENFVS